MFIVHATMSIRADAADAFAEAAAELTRAARADPACVAYLMTVDPLDPSTATVFELWQDAASFTSYAVSEHAAAYARCTAGLRTGPTTVTLLAGELVHAGPAPEPAALTRIVARSPSPGRRRSRVDEHRAGPPEAEPAAP